MTSPPHQTAAPPLTAAYPRAISLFSDWCTATGRTVLPCSWASVQAFLDAAGGPPATRRL